MLIQHLSSLHELSIMCRCVIYSGQIGFLYSELQSCIEMDMHAKSHTSQQSCNHTF